MSSNSNAFGDGSNTGHIQTFDTSKLPAGTQVGMGYNTANLELAAIEPSHRWPVVERHLLGGTSDNCATHRRVGYPAAGPAGTLSVSTTSKPSGTVGVLCSMTLGASGGAPAYTWSILSGSIAACGLSLNTSTGVVSSTPQRPQPAR